MKIALRFSAVHFQETSLSRCHVLETQYRLHMAPFLKVRHFLMKIKPFGNALKIPFAFRMSERPRLKLQKCHPTFRHRTSAQSILSRSKSIVYKTPQAPSVS